MLYSLFSAKNDICLYYTNDRHEIRNMLDRDVQTDVPYMRAGS